MVNSPKGRVSEVKRIFPRNVGCVLLACGLTSAVAWLGWPVYKSVAYTRMTYDVLDRIDSLKTKRPANITAERWEDAVGWARTAVCNVPVGGPEDPAPMRQFRHDLHERIVAGDSLGVLRWIWSELERQNASARDYALRNKPLRAMTPDPVTDDTLNGFWSAATCGVLDLSDTQITDAGLGHLTKMTGLFNLQLNRTRVTDGGLVQLARLPRIRFLGLAGCTIGNAGLVHLEGLKDLEVLDLSETRITDAGLEQLQKLSGLRYLGLRKTHVTDSGAKRLGETLLRCRIER